VSQAHEHIDDLIASYLAGEATADEVAFVDDWRNQSEANSRYFEQLRVIFEKSTVPVRSADFDTDGAWIKMRQKLAVRKTVPLYSNRNRSGFTFLKIAAGIVILIVAGLFSYNFFGSNSFQSMEVLSDIKTELDTLPDGTGVFLNRQTKIQYEFDKKNDTHIARVKGEAFFDINHDDDKTFIVEADGTFIRDIGTSFNVKAYPDSRTIEVVVEEGEVVFYTNDDAGIHLKANDKGIYSKDSETFTIAQPEPNATAYRTKVFSFRDHSLEDVVARLNDVYLTRIEIDKNLKSCRLTVSFNNENIEEIAHIIAETLGLTVTKSDNMIKLTGEGCGKTQP
jgi:transmembrane sensor